MTSNFVCYNLVEFFYLIEDPENELSSASCVPIIHWSNHFAVFIHPRVGLLGAVAWKLHPILAHDLAVRKVRVILVTQGVV